MSKSFKSNLSETTMFMCRPAHMPEVSLITKHSAPYNAPRHFHDELEISLQHNGVSELTYRGEIHCVPARNFTLTHPGEVHSARSLVPAQGLFRGMRIGLPLLKRVSAQVAGHEQPLPFFVFPLYQNADVEQMLLRAHTLLSDATILALEQETVVLTTLVHLLTHCAVGQKTRSAPSLERQAVERIRDYLETCYADNVSLTQLAGMVDLSPYYLNRVFRAQIGMPPHAYQIQVRVLRAKTLLSQGWSPSHAAFETGFASQSHLTGHFKTLVGVTPSQYCRCMANRKNVVDFAV